MADKRISQLIERTDIANNDVLPIVASGATTTNKVTISTIQEWMQDNLDVGVTSVGITIGSTGTDVNVTGSPITTSGNITINIPTASATNRGLLSAADWSTFNAKQPAGNYVTLDTTQTITAHKTFTASGGQPSITINHSSGAGHALDITKAGNGEGIRVVKSSGTGNAMTIIGSGNSPALSVQKSSGLGDALTITGGSLLAQSANFVGNIWVSNGVQLSSTGGALTTNLQNISGTGLITSGANGIGFNGSNNFFFSGSDKGCAVFVVNNTGTRNYTLQDASGTLAFTSQIPANPVGGTGTTNQIPKFSGTSTLTNSNISDNGTEVNIQSRLFVTSGGQQFVFTPNLATTSNRIETTGSLPLEIVSGGNITFAAGGATPQITLASSGAVTFANKITINTPSDGIGILLNGRTSDNFSSIRFGANTGGGQYNSINVSSSSFDIISIGNTPITFGTNTTGGGSTRMTIGGDGTITLAGALNGTSASFTGVSPRVSAQGNTSTGFPGFQLSNTTQGYEIIVRGNASNALQIRNSTASTDLLSISSTGAATFSSSVTAGGNVLVPAGSGLAFAGGATRIMTPEDNVQGAKIATPGGFLVEASVHKFIGGNVGIGTPSPSRTLDIKGSGGVATVLKLEGAVSSTFLQLAYNGATPSQSGYIGYDGSSNMSFLINDTERMRITSGGNVLVGFNQTTTTTIGRTFTTTHASANRGATLFYGINDGSNGGMFVYNVAASNPSLNSQYVTFETHEGGVRGGEVMRLTSDAYLRMASGTGGIQFNGDTAAANALDDYEEGTWTPVVIGSSTNGSASYTSQNGRYTKIGNVVYFRADIIWSSHTGTGNIIVNGLPFAIAQAYMTSVNLRFDQTTTSNNYLGGAFIFGSSVYPSIMPVGGGGGSDVPMRANGDMRFSGFYFV